MLRERIEEQYLMNNYDWERKIPSIDFVTKMENI
jgi:hypothetical protein